MGEEAWKEVVEDEGFSRVSWALQYEYPVVFSTAACISPFLSRILSLSLSLSLPTEESMGLETKVRTENDFVSRVSSLVLSLLLFFL